MIHLQVINQLYLPSSHANSVCFAVWRGFVFFLGGGWFFCLFVSFFILSSFPSPVVEPRLEKVSLDHKKQQFFTDVPRVENVWLLLDVTPLVLAQYNNLSVTVWNYRKTMCKSKFSCKLTLSLIKNNFQRMTSAKLLFYRYLLTPANIKYTTDVGERGLTVISHPNWNTEFLQENLHTVTLLQADYTHTFSKWLVVLACI